MLPVRLEGGFGRRFTSGFNFTSGFTAISITMKGVFR